MAQETITPNAATGHYARKQLLCSSRLIAWSHKSRFRLARRLIESYAGKRLLDYGCGDGTLLCLVSGLFSQSTGADLDAPQVEECRRRLLTHGRRSDSIAFVHTTDLASSPHRAAYDVVLCMEVLEHCTDEAREVVLADLQRLVASDGVVIISVPVEIGVSLFVKQVARTIAGWRRLGDYQYRERYSIVEFWKSFFASGGTRINRPLYHGTDDSSHPYHGHKGFNWISLSEEVCERFAIERVIFSPVPWLRSLINSQVWFVCRAR